MSKQATPAPTHIEIATAHLAPAGVYDEYGHEYRHHEVHQHLTRLLGKHVTDLATISAKHADDAAHPAHEMLADAFHSRIKGRWRVTRWNAPIEHYAGKLLGLTEEQVIEKYGHFQALPAHIQERALHALTRGEGAGQIDEWEDYDPHFDNVFCTRGISALWNIAGGSGQTNTGGAAPLPNAFYNNTQARIGVGDNSTAGSAAAADTDLNAAVNRLWIGMDATFPTLPAQTSGQLIMRATYGSAQANFGWQEFAADNRNGSNVTTPGSAANVAGNGSMLDHVISNQGTKAAGQTWQPTLTLTIS